MPTESPILFAWPAGLWAGVILLIAAIVMAMLRRPAMPRTSLAWLGAGMLCLSLAAGQMTWRYQRAGRVAVVVDLSPSTRTARFRDPAQLHDRLAQLLGRTRYTLYAMSDRTMPVKRDRLPGELPSDQTRYDPPPADAVVLFSDGQFPLPGASPPTYPVVDPALDHPADARVDKLELRHGQVMATVSNTTGHPRTLTLNGATPTTQPVDPGHFVLAGRPLPQATDVWAILRGRDPWPENDGLNLRLPPPVLRQRWWVGQRNPGGDWRPIDPHALPADLSDYLAAGVIVLDNVSADDFNREQLWALEHYVEDFGGGAVILGGSRAFAAGGYAGSFLDRLSPLAGTPPRPLMHWVLLGDSSGSMSAAIGDNSRWAFAADAMTRLVRVLPPDDLVSIGNFAQRLHWWRSPLPARAIQRDLSVPRNIRPTGPTNLAAALQIVADTVDPHVPTQLLLITDAQVKIDNPGSLAQKLLAANVHVWVLATGNVPADNPLRQIVDRTGGHFLTQADPRQWAGDLHQLLRAAAPKLLEDHPLTVSFTPSGPALPPLQTAPWNRTWLKSAATELAVGHPSAGASTTALTTSPAESVPAIAAWNLGSGAVIAAAFPASAQLAALLSDRVAAPPRDPRFTVTWDAADTLTVTLDAFDPHDGYMNHFSPQLELSTDGRKSKSPIPLPQIGPGRYRAATPAPKKPCFASLYADGRLLDRIPVAGRYAPEFNHLGNNRAHLEELARRSNGQVIEPGRTTPINFHWPRASLPLTPWLAGAGATLIAIGLIRWRRG